MKTRIASLDDLDIITELVFNAFKNYPLYTNVSVFDEKLLHQFLYIDTKVNIKKDNYFVCLQNDQIVSTFCLVPSNQEEANLYQYVKNGGYKLIKNLDILNEIFSNLDEAESTLENIPKGYWYLDTLAVNPKFQGKGIGSKTINNGIIQYIQNHDDNNNDLYLITNTKLNCKFYKKNGFKEIDYHRSGNDIDTWAFKIKL